MYNVSDNNLLTLCTFRIKVISLNTFYAPERTSGGILKSHRSSVSPFVRYKFCLSNNLLTTEANLMKLHGKVKHNEVCRAEGHNHVRGQNRDSESTKNLLSKFNETSWKNRT